MPVSCRTASREKVSKSYRELLPCLQPASRFACMLVCSSSASCVCAVHLNGFCVYSGLFQQTLSGSIAEALLQWRPSPRLVPFGQAADTHFPASRDKNCLVFSFASQFARMPACSLAVWPVVSRAVYLNPFAFLVLMESFSTTIQREISGVLGDPYL